MTSGPSGRLELSRQYIYVRSRQLEGTFSADPRVGTWVITAARISRGWGQPPESAWPYNGDAAAWPPVEPAGVDGLAKANRITSYQRARDLEECRKVLAAGQLVVAAVEIVPGEWTAAEGVIPLPSDDEAATAMHTVTIVGYSDALHRVKFANSWGVAWGDSGYGTLPYEYFDRRVREMWLIGPRDERRTTATSGLVEREWGLPDILGDVLHCVELYLPESDDTVAWGFAVTREGFLDVEELFVRPVDRRQGFGTALAQLFQARAQKLGLPIRFWVPHVDATDTNLATLTRLTRKLGLTVQDTAVLWASYVIAAPSSAS